MMTRFHIKEIWVESPSNIGVMVSSWGRIKLPNKYDIPLPRGGTRDYITKPTYGNISSASKTAQHKYRNIYSKDFGNLKIHRLVCEAFHGMSPSKELNNVLHIDEDSLNNHYLNLKWGTKKENSNAPKFILLSKKSIKLYLIDIINRYSK